MLWRNLRVLAGVLTFLALSPLAMAQVQSWDEIVADARGGTVYWNAWGGDEAVNDYIAWVGTRLKELYDIDLVHVKLSDTAQAVRKVVAEKAAGRHEGGSVDLIWINGENFKAMKDQALLYGPFVDVLPNFALIDPIENPAATLDFTVPTEGLEAPWGQARLVFIHDLETVASPPTTISGFLQHAEANRGRVTYPAPPQFIGSTFLKQALYESVEEPEVLLLPAGDNFKEVTAPLWTFLERLSPFLWRSGNDFPVNEDALIRLLDEGEVDFAISFSPGKAALAVSQGLLPDTVRTFSLPNGTIGNTHFVAIPYNAANRSEAMVLANFLMSPEAQSRKQNPEIWGDTTVLSMSRLAPEDRALFDALPLADATITPAELGPSLPEPHPSWMTRIETAWLLRYGN